MKAKFSRRVKWIYLAALLLSLHYAFVVYINSNFLSQFFSEQYLSLLYTLGSCLTIFCFIAAPRLVKKFGLGRLLLFGIVLEFIALFGLFSSTIPEHIAFFFLIHQAMPTLLLFGLDVFLEDTLRTENITGQVRSMYLTIINIAFLLSPLVVGNIIEHSSYRVIYMISAAFCFLLFFVVGDELQPIKLRALEETSFRDTIHKIIPRKSLKIIIFLDFLLQSFYALMVVYMSIYLHQTIGFDWATIGILFTIMLVPFVIFEAPLGRIFDHIHIEIDTLILGFLIMSGSLIVMSLTNSHNIILWAVLLFVSRVGASFVEVGSEFSFFKRVTGRDAGFISFFRMTVPLAYALVPLIVQIFLPFIQIQTIFLFSGIILLLGIFYSLRLRTAR